MTAAPLSPFSGAEFPHGPLVANDEQARADARFGRGDGPTLLVASTGGHLEQLLRLRQRLAPSSGPWEWATFDGEQPRALLRGETVHHVDYIKPRDVTAALRALPSALRIVQRGGYRAVVSTGSGIAVPFFLAARLHNVPNYYIESAARSLGPSLTGKLVRRIPGTRLFTQYPEWADEKWHYCGSLFDGFENAGSAAARLGETSAPGRVVVTLGTMPEYGFRRAAERLTTLLPEVCAADAEVLWQTGATDVSGLGISGHDQIPADELRAAIHDADLVVSHGGIGSALTALDAGRTPVMLPRRVAFGEHVDDHQVMICSLLGDRGIAVSREVDVLGADDLWAAAHSSTRASAVQQMTLEPAAPAAADRTARHRGALSGIFDPAGSRRAA